MKASRYNRWFITHVIRRYWARKMLTCQPYSADVIERIKFAIASDQYGATFFNEG